MMERLKESKWVYILISILLALVFWLYVRAEVNPSGTITLRNVPVQLSGVSVLTQQGLTVSNLSADTVTLRLEAPASVQDDLYQYRDDVSVVLDVSRCEEGENRLRYEISYPQNVNQDSIVTQSRSPEVITVTVEKLYTKTFTVEFQLEGSVAEGHQPGTAAINPETVVVSGSVEQVSQVSRVVAILREENLKSQFAGDLPLTLLDGENQPLTDLEVTLSSESAYVVLPVVSTKTVELTVNFIAGGGATQDDIVYSIEPDTITVAGADEDIAELTEISLGSIDLSTVEGTGEIQRTMTIDLDPRLENVSGITTATVSITIEGLETRTFQTSNITASDIQGYNVSLVTQALTVQVRGRAEDLDLIDASQIRVVADLSSITSTGTFPVPARVYLDAGGASGVLGSYTVVVNVSR